MSGSYMKVLARVGSATENSAALKAHVHYSNVADFGLPNAAGSVFCRVVVLFTLQQRQQSADYLWKTPNVFCRVRNLPLADSLDKQKARAVTTNLFIRWPYMLRDADLLCQ